MITTEPGDEVDAFLQFLRAERGFDFTGYKRPSLLRRIERRIKEVGVGSLGEYQEHLELHPEEFPVLFDTILIKVTEFFRDPDAWELLRERVIVPLAERAETGEPLRVWSAGCATGEEAFTLAMVLAETLGEARFASGVKLYATDIDEDALARARAAHLLGAPAREPGRGTPDPLLRRGGNELRVQAGSAPQPDLRSPRPHERRPDRPPRPVVLSQHADVLRRGAPGPGGGPLPLRLERRRVPVPRPG